MIALLLALGAVQAATLQLDADKNRPVTKVVNLLKDMSAQLQKEGEEDEATYQKVACWCTTNDKEKTASIAEAEAKISTLTANIEEFTAVSARLSTEIKNLEAEIAKNQEALAKATEIRKKELAEFNAEEKDMLQAIGALKSAVTVLSKHHSSFVQSDAIFNTAASMEHMFRKFGDSMDFTSSQKKTVAAFMQSPTEFIQQAPTNDGSYAPQSGQIFGILKQMQETFENNLSQSQKDEMNAQQTFEAVKSAKEAEIAAGEEQRDQKTQERADTDQALADAKQDLEDTRNSLSADQKFLMNLKETCQMTDAEWEERQKLRNEEIQACAEAVAILSGDDAHDTFTKTFNFVQVQAQEEDKLRVRASTVLFSAAKKYGSPKLAAIASSVRLDAFTKVKAAIDDMISALLKEKDDEIKHKDFCNKGLNENSRSAALKERDIEELDALINNLASQIDQLSKEIATLESEIAEMQTQLKRAGEDREQENGDFQTTVADQRATQGLLTKALNVLQKVYKSFAQTSSKQEPAGPPPPAGFKKFERNAAGGGVVGMLQQIITEAKQLEGDAIKAETDSQKAYETFVKDTNNGIEERNNSIVNKSDTKAKAEGDKTAAEEGKEAATNELQQLSNEAADLHKACDFTVKNFDIRQEARDQEVEALRQAKAILSGAKFSEFLQKRA